MKRCQGNEVHSGVRREFVNCWMILKAVERDWNEPV